MHMPADWRSHPDFSSGLKAWLRNAFDEDGTMHVKPSTPLQDALYRAGVAQLTAERDAQGAK
jgi:hypothetical protein